MVQRPDTHITGGEREMLDVFLDHQRATVLLKAEGLSDADAARRLLPSATAVSGMLRHLADVERSWFVETFAGLPYQRRFGSDADPDGEWRVGPQDSLTEIAADYQAACAEARAAVASAELTDRCRQGPPADLRWVLLHMIEETARHAASWTSCASSWTAPPACEPSPRHLHGIAGRGSCGKAPGPEQNRRLASRLPRRPTGHRGRHPAAHRSPTLGAPA